MLLGASALLWMAAGAYAATLLRDKPDSGRFVVWWLMTLTGSLGVFIAADLVGFYLFFTVVSLSAYGLIVFDETSTARRAGAVYVSLALLGEAFLLMGFVLLAPPKPGRQPAHSRRCRCAGDIALAQRDADISRARICAQNRHGAIARLDAAGLYGGAHSRRGRAQRRSSQGRRDFCPLHPVPAIAAGLGRRRSLPPVFSRRSTAC